MSAVILVLFITLGSVSNIISFIIVKILIKDIDPIPCGESSSVA